MFRRGCGGGGSLAGGRRSVGGNRLHDVRDVRSLLRIRLLNGRCRTAGFAAGLVMRSGFGARTPACVAATVGAGRGEQLVTAPRGDGGLTGAAAPVIALMVDPKPCVATSGRPRAAAPSAASAATPTSAHTRRPRRGARAALAALSERPSSFASSFRRVRPGVQTCCAAASCASSYRVERPRPTRTTSPANTSSDRSREAWERATPVRRAYRFWSGTRQAPRRVPEALAVEPQSAQLYRVVPRAPLPATTRCLLWTITHKTPA